ncbi:hypothetical protein [Candidatus Poriferisocius sp.]|uniref:hypothetical protein n=1 Tax=Candidatus Poriferisocius sp. TaxID=3101276 RepID=UPI003B013CBD
MTADLIESEDLAELRLEILRLRDQTLGVEVRNQYLSGHITNQNDRIAELENQVAERDSRVEEWKSRVAERDARIAEKDIRIAEKDARIAELTGSIILRAVRRILPGSSKT